ncbi:anhydro-N-acetylmuramic acid kinase [Paracoccus sp. Z330]|uniref:Anhydro-N-acetylmuramic acid kinase n=1 Tax=Paracoccus onchidii TaxID=3017813 RepID=A0ABT4ZHA6_9RHOB|nr:anhydro-N-acetylmuramic acid kinase [Paracoccus onchidii]MDB6178698.1 anhydro-N-acetylmuramic acid kinase [Paracoccus onchidii]
MIRALGMMSGTSLDGVDAAEIETDGVTIAGFGKSSFRRYGDNEATILHGALGRWPGEAGVAAAAAVSVSSHAALAQDFPDARLIAYHGQTLAHDPHGRGTHQAGDGAALAQMTGRPVVWDFRSEDVRRGGEGAPLAPFFHWACARWAVRNGHLPAAPVGFLNLGGVGNITWVDPRCSAPESDHACLAFDTGPANAPINDLMRQRLRQSHDADGRLAASGTADPDILRSFLTHSYFERVPPKSLDRDQFNGLVAAVEPLADADAAATLVAALAGSVGAAWRWLPSAPATVLVCGGGRRNESIMSALRSQLDADVQAVEAVGLDGDMLEAQAFAWLAVRVQRGLPTSGPKTTAAPGPVCGGRISHPKRSFS